MTGLIEQVETPAFHSKK